MDSALETGNMNGSISNVESASNQGGQSVLITSKTMATTGGTPSTSSRNPSLANSDTLTGPPGSSLAACKLHNRGILEL